jgi:hypothetical protein
VKRSLLLVSAMLLLMACETSTDPLDGIINGGGGAVTPAEATGTWTFTLQRTTTFPCTGALASGQTITAFVDVLSDGTLSTASTWQDPVSNVVNALSGAVTLSNGALRLTFAATAGAAMELTSGTMTANGTITTATITDPSAGFTQVFGSDVCQYTATATKAG